MVRFPIQKTHKDEGCSIADAVKIYDVPSCGVLLDNVSGCAAGQPTPTISIEASVGVPRATV